MTMTTGEFEFDTIFQQTGAFKGEDDITYPVISYVLWILFLVLMPILLTNLLVSLNHTHSLIMLKSPFPLDRLV